MPLTRLRMFPFIPPLLTVFIIKVKLFLEKARNEVFLKASGEGAALPTHDLHPLILISGFWSPEM